MNQHKALELADLGQQDCFWHDHSTDLCYLLVLPGVVSGPPPSYSAATFAQTEGRVTYHSREFQQLCNDDPDCLPGPDGPVTVLLIL